MSTNTSPHNHGGRNHLLGMIIVGGVVLVALVATGRSLGEAVPVAALLACPLMMIGMMFIMMRGNTAQQRQDIRDTHHDGHRPTLDDDPTTPEAYAPRRPPTHP